MKKYGFLFIEFGEPIPKAEKPPPEPEAELVVEEEEEVEVEKPLTVNA